MSTIIIIMSMQTMLENPLFWGVLGLFILFALMELFLYKKVSNKIIQEVDDFFGEDEEMNANFHDEPMIIESPQQNVSVWLPTGLTVLECHNDFELKMLKEDFAKLGQKAELDAEELYYYSLLSATLAKFHVCL